MPWLATNDLTPSTPLGGSVSEQIYNGLDCMVTLEVYEELEKLIDPENPPLPYNFSRAVQAPALEMMLRGFKVDQTERQIAIQKLQQRIDHLENHVLQAYAHAIWDRPLNPRSQQQLIAFFYEHMRLPEQWTSQKGQRKLSMNRESLEKLEQYFQAMPVVACILTIRDLTKKLQTIEAEVDGDGRIRTSYNVAGTETWRWSSSKNAYGGGGNLQNWENELRRILVADPGEVLVGIDLEQAESREVGWLCGTLFDDWTYLDACYAGDLHSFTCALVWRDLVARSDLMDDKTGELICKLGTPFTDNAKWNRAIAEQSFYRHFTYRDMSKRGGHGSNYYGTPWTMARHLKVPVQLMVDFQGSYFEAFPGIPQYHRHTAGLIQTTHRVENSFGFERIFFGRPNDDTTLREAIAFSPQSSTGVRMNLGMWKVWNAMGHKVKLLAQIHDAIYWSCKPELVGSSIEEGLSLIDIRLRSGSRELIVPGEAKWGWNMANYDPKRNPNGLAKWKGKIDREREGVMQRRF